MNDLTLKNVWLVGGSTGIGKELVGNLASSCSKVFVSARNYEQLDEICANAKTGNVFSYPCDVTESSTVDNAFKEIISDHRHIDVLILNVGTYYPSDGSINALEYEQQMAVNYLGPVKVLENVLPYFIRKGAGHIIGICSLSAFRAMPLSGGYGPSKSALKYLLETIRLDLKKHTNLKISIVYPGFVKTRLTDKNKFYMPFLMSPEMAAQKIMYIVRKGRGDYSFPYLFSLGIKVLSILPGVIHRFIFTRSIR